MHLLLLLSIFIQVPVQLQALSISNLTLQKLHSISQWLDSTGDATVFDYIYRTNRGVGLNLYQGDIKGYNPRHGHVRTAITNHNQLWNTRVVPYVIDTAFDSAAMKEIMAAVEEYHNKTCLRFVPRTSQADYIHFKQISGCYSNVGRTGGGQEISLAGPCLRKGTAVHEMMHAIGFWHEQSRPDRDSWVRVISGNIESGKAYNFDKLTPSEADTLGVPYDYGSVMHYSRYAFSRNGNPTLLPIRPTRRQLGQRYGLSQHDVQRINILYRCDIQGPTSPPAVTMPPQTQPPVTRPPATHLIVTHPPTQPPTQPPRTQPHTTLPPHTHPPQTQPRTKLRKTQPPHTQPPHTQRPHTQPPQTQSQRTPQTQPPRTQPQTTPQTQPPQRYTSQTSQKPHITQQPLHLTSPPIHPLPVTSPPLHTIPSVGWTTWSQWTPRDLECRHSRYRFCLSYDPTHCPGDRSEARTCPFPCQPAVSLGCWKSGTSRLLVPSVEGQAATLTDQYATRTESVRKCSDFAAQRGYTVFAVFNGGMCLTGADAHKDFSEAGVSGECGYQGIGGPGAYNVFSFQSLKTKCGRQYHAGGPGTSGVIWVRDYENFMECEYKIATGDRRASISIYIHQIDVEFSRGCIYDALMLHDGSGPVAPLVGSYCGQTPPGTFESTSNRLYLHFESDETNAGRGFTVFYNINSRSRKACARPPPTRHMSVRQEGNMVGDRVFYSCHPGYRMIGHPTLTCRDQPGFALWDESFPKCVDARKRSIRQRVIQRCDFEDSLCGFTNDVTGDFDWTVRRPGVGSNTSTGTALDGHGAIGYSGNYLQSTSTRLHAPGDLARASFSVEGTTSLCLNFRYSIDGGELAIFNVYAGHINARNFTDDGMSEDNDNGDELLWSRHGDTSQESAWKTASVKMDLTGHVKITFEAILGDEIGSSVSIDNVFLTSGSC